MMKKYLLLIAVGLASATTLAAYSPSTIVTDPAGVNQAAVKAASTAASATDPALVVGVSPNTTVKVTAPSPLPVVVVSPLPTGTNSLGSVVQGTPGPTSSPWPVVLPSGTPIQVTGAFYPATQPVSIASPLPVTGAFFQSVQPVSAPSALPVAVVSPLPAGTNSLGSVVQGTPGPTASPWPVILPSGTPVQTTGTYWQTTQPVNQVAGATDTQTTGTVSTVVTLTAPSNAQGFILQNLQTSAANVRFAMGATASATLGMELAPGQDSGFVPTSVSVSICSESGTNNYNVQWVAK
jgi:hypothetical protein